MNEKDMFLYIVGTGVTKEGSAAILGNLMAESGLKATNLQNVFEKKLGLNDIQYTTAVDNGSYVNFVYDGAGYGLAQWTFWSRKQNLLNYAKSTGKSIGDYEMQLSFLISEMSQYGKLWNDLRSLSDVDYLTDEVLTVYEKPADMSDSVKQKRRSYAKEILSRCCTESIKNQNGDSSLVNVIIPTTKHSNKRTSPISKITIHHMAGVMSAKNCIEYHKNSIKSVSANYYIGKDGEIGQSVPEGYRAWTSSSEWNDQRAVTIEVSNSAKGEPWPISGNVYKSLISLCVDICKRNNIKEVHYTGDKNGSLTCHCFYTNTLCPGTTIKSLLENHSIENDINLKLKDELNQNQNDEQKTVKYTVTADSLNIRREPNAKSEIDGYLLTDSVVSIEKIEGNWGYFSGWINLRYTRKT